MCYAMALPGCCYENDFAALTIIRDLQKNIFNMANIVHCMGTLGFVRFILLPTPLLTYHEERKYYVV